MACDCDRLCSGQLRHAVLHLMDNKTSFEEVQGAVRQEPCLYQCCHSGSHIRSRMLWGAPAITLLGKLEEMGSLMLPTKIAAAQHVLMASSQAGSA